MTVLWYPEAHLIFANYTNFVWVTLLSVILIHIWSTTSRRIQSMVCLELATVLCMSLKCFEGSHTWRDGHLHCLIQFPVCYSHNTCSMSYASSISSFHRLSWYISAPIGGILVSAYDSTIFSKSGMQARHCHVRSVL